MVFTVIFILILSYCRCIELVLPFRESDIDNFYIKTNFLSLTSIGEPHEILHKLTYFESKRTEMITSVIFHGSVIYKTNHKYERNARRIVNYAALETKIVISILYIRDIMTEFEKVICISYETLFRIMEEPGRIIQIIEGRDKSTIGSILNGIICGIDIPKRSKNEYDELDTVDDAPYLVQGRNDIKIKELKERNSDKEDNNERNKDNNTNKYNNSNISDKDLLEAGPSGIENNKIPNIDKRLKETRIYIPDSDSD